MRLFFWGGDVYEAQNSERLQECVLFCCVESLISLRSHLLKHF